MSNIHEPTKEELQTIAHAIADGKSVIDTAADLGIDRSSLSGWLKREGFLDMVAAALDTPAELGVEGFRNLFDKERQDGERRSAYFLRLDFAGAMKRAHSSFFAAMAEYERQQAECRAADALNIDALITLEKRGWKRGTADEKARGLKTAKQRRDYRRRHGLKWDWQGLGCYFEERWSAKKCRIAYADEEGMDWMEQRRRFGMDWEEVFCNSHSGEDVRTVNTRPLEVLRDARLPVTAKEAEVFLQAVNDGADFAEAAARARGLAT